MSDGDHAEYRSVTCSPLPGVAAVSLQQLGLLLGHPAVCGVPQHPDQRLAQQVWLLAQASVIDSQAPALQGMVDRVGMLSNLTPAGDPV